MKQNIGALWLHQGRAGQADYFLGSITVAGKKVEIAVFANKFRDGIAKRPHYIITQSTRTT